MTTTDSALVLAQVLGDEGDEALYKGNWAVAARKYVDAANQCSDALQTADQATKSILEKLLSRYSEKAQQIQEYLDTPSISVMEDSQNISVWPGSVADSFMPFGTLLHGADSSVEVVEPPPTTNAGTFRSIMTGIETLFTKYIYNPSSIPLSELSTETPVDLNSSFILLSDGPDINPNDFGKRVTLGEHLKNTDADSSNRPTAVDPHIESLLAEIKTLKASNQALKEANLKLTETCLRLPAVHGLIQENTHLKKSFINFRKQVTTLASQYSQAESRPRAQSRTPDRIHALEENIRSLHEKLEAKDAQIQELEEFRVKWEKLKHDARQKRKAREGNSDINTSEGFWVSDVEEIARSKT